MQRTQAKQQQHKETIAQQWQPTTNKQHFKEHQQ